MTVLRPRLDADTLHERLRAALGHLPDTSEVAAALDRWREAETENIEKAAALDLAEIVRATNENMASIAPLIARELRHLDTPERETARRLGVAPGTVRKWVNRTALIPTTPDDPMAQGTVAPRKRVTHDD